LVTLKSLAEGSRPAQVVEYMPSKSKALSANPSTTTTKKKKKRKKVWERMGHGDAWLYLSYLGGGGGKIPNLKLAWVA
jgi:hypothetical protein